MKLTPPERFQERGQPCPPAGHRPRPSSSSSCSLRRFFEDEGRERGGGRGFTLIELILVMALLSIVLAVSAPSLARFFRSRTLDSEARRFLALTRYGQSRAVSEGVPMVLWIDAQQGAYGLTAESTYAEQDGKAVQYTLDNTLSVQVETPTVRTQFTQWNPPTDVAKDAPTIRFTPDGFISETSPERVLIRQGDDGGFWIAQSRNRLNYEMQADNSLSR